MNIVVLLFALLIVPVYPACAETVHLPWRDVMFDVAIPDGYVDSDKINLYNREFFRRSQNPYYSVLLFLSDKFATGPASNYGAFKVAYENDPKNNAARYAFRIKQLRQELEDMPETARQANERAKQLGVPGRSVPEKAKLLGIAIDKPNAFGFFTRSSRYFSDGSDKAFTVVYLSAFLLLRGQEIHVLLYRTENNSTDFETLREVSMAWINQLLAQNDS